MEKQNDELFAELDQIVVDLEKEAASKKKASKKVDIHCRQNGQLLFTRSVTVEEDD